ncbi:MAG: hypothetical protein RL385_3930 [Pseudomonadota bacterium]|jgi:twitching motility protein PilT
MQFDKMFRVLTRDDVKEIALQTDRPPCALVGAQWTPLFSVNLSEEDVLAALVEAGGRSEVLALGDGPRSWDAAVDGVGLVRVSAGFRGATLQARIKLLNSSQDRPKQSPAAPVPATQAAQTGAQRASLTSPASPQGFSLAPTSAPQAHAVERPRPVASQTAAAVTSGEPAGVLESVLRVARDRNATDLHLVSERPALARIGGDLVPISGVLPDGLLVAVLEHVLPARAKQELRASGSTDFAIDHPSCGRFRGNAGRQRTGHKLTFRLVGDRIPTLADLGLPAAIAGATNHHQGLIVVTGPTGHGKTTTLAAIVDVLNSDHTHHIITVEDPVEYVHPRKRSMISQREVGTHTKSFAAALKGSLREDPDVIVVGELRDTETVRMALSASETGHLVIATMNTQSAAKTIERIIDLFPPGDQPQVRMSLAGGLRLIISQRLVPSADGTRMHAAAELLPGTPPLWAMIRDNKTFQIPSLQQRGKSLGIIRLDDSLAELVRTGKTRLDIAQRFAEAPDQLEALVLGKK